MRSVISLLLVVVTFVSRHAPASEVVVVAGGGSRAVESQAVPAIEAALVDPFAVDFDADGNMYICELEGGRILRVTQQGQLSRLAGNAEKADAGDGGPVEQAVFNGMHHLLIGPDGNLLIADTWNNRVRRIDLAGGTIGPFAGAGTKGFAGDGGPALRAEFGGIYCLAIGPSKDKLYLVDLDNRRVRAMDIAAGTVSTVAGNGEKGLPTDGATAHQSPLVDPRAATVDSQGNLYILERSGHALRVVDSKGRIRTVAGTGEAGYSGDDGPAIKAKLNGPKHLCVDAEDNVLIADTENHVIRKYWPRTGRITHVAGTGQEASGGIGGPAAQVGLSRPHGVTFGPDGCLYISDSGNGRVLKVVP